MRTRRNRGLKKFFTFGMLGVPRKNGKEVIAMVAVAL
jgi:hypothetical protein